MKRLPLGAGEPFAHWRSWGEGFVNVNDAGHLEVITNTATAGKADLHELVTRLQRQGVRLPVLVRFPQLIDRQMETLQRAFKTATETFDFRGSFTSVYPLKVNSRKATVARICAAGRPHGAGLEVGTKAELCIALSMLRDSTGPIICNGYKDSAYLELRPRPGRPATTSSWCSSARGSTSSSPSCAPRGCRARAWVHGSSSTPAAWAAGRSRRATSPSSA